MLVFGETEEFIKLARNRYKIEATNSELENARGYHTAKSSGLFGMEIQSLEIIILRNVQHISSVLNN